MDVRIRTTLKKLMRYKPEKVILFGSHAKGSSDSHSDIDLIVVKKTKKAFLDRLKEVIGIIKPNFALDILVYTPREFKGMLRERNTFLEFVLKEGKVLYERKQ